MLCDTSQHLSRLSFPSEAGRRIFRSPSLGRTRRASDKPSGKNGLVSGHGRADQAFSKMGLAPEEIFSCGSGLFYEPTSGRKKSNTLRTLHFCSAPPDVFAGHESRRASPAGTAAAWYSERAARGKWKVVARL